MLEPRVSDMETIRLLVHTWAMEAPVSLKWSKMKRQSQRNH